MAAKVLVFGANGQVARALAKAETPFELIFAGRAALDLADASADIAGLIGAIGPAAVINASAYTAVDRAEADVEPCARLNRDAPARMAESCRALGIPLTHFSTDYVFDGEKGHPYVEADPVSPLGVYARTKAEGEAELAKAAASGARLAVVRASWVFAPGGGGFLGAMLRLARERTEVSVVGDQWGSPTAAAACADAALTLTTAMLDGEGRAEGLFHAAGGDDMTWADFAEAIFAGLAGRGLKHPALRRILAADYAAAAPRPRDTRLSSAKITSTVGWRPPPFLAALDMCLNQMEFTAR